VDSATRRVSPLAELIQTVTPVKRSRRPADFSLRRKESILPKDAGESAARRLIRLTDIISRVGLDKGTRRPTETTMEPKVKNTEIRSGGNGRWAVAPGTHVAITFLGLYYARWGVISKILCWDPLLVEVKIIEVSPAIEVEIPFPVGDLRRISQCAGWEVIWEAEHLRPYGALSEEPLETLGGPPTPVPEDVMPTEEVFTLAKGMVIVLVDTDAPLPRCARVGIIEECAPKGVWSGFVVPHSFFVTVRVQVVNWEYKNHAAYCESPNVQTLGCAARHKILWSGYKVRPLHADRTSP
jgi:hypothetical protein